MPHPTSLCRVRHWLPILAFGLAAAGSIRAQAPAIGAHPVSQAVAPGGSFSLGVSATGSGALSYQWTRNGAPIPGATNASYVAAAAQFGHVGRYAVAVTNTSGTTYSAPAQVDLTGNLWASGSNTSGLLGDGTTTRRLTPMKITTDVGPLAAGYYHALFVKADRTLWAMGQGFSGQLGDGSVSQRNSPVQVATGVVAAAAGESHSLFVKSDGTLWGMGTNSSGALGDGTSTQRNSPVNIASGVVAAAAGSGYSLFLKSDGTVWGTGQNASGQLGDGSATTRYLPVLVATGVSAIAAGRNHSLFLKTDGTLWATGLNTNGQLGDGTTTSRLLPVLVASGVATIAAGANHTMYVKTDGTLWGTGQNSYSQLGDVTSTQRTTPVQVAVGVAAVTAGTYHTQYLKTDGTLWAMGWSSSGQIGDGTTFQRFVHVQGSTNVQRVAAGDTASYFTQAAGVGGAPGLLNPPTSGTYTAGSTIGLSVVATGSGPFEYRWFRDGVELLGFRDSTYFIASFQVADAGTYTVAVSNSGGTTVSTPATLVYSAVPLVAPTIVVQPVSQAVPFGSVVGFTVTATGSTPLYYQWRKNGVPFAGAVTASHVMNNLQADDAASYDVVVSNSQGAVTSSAAVLTLTPAVWFTVQPTNRSVFAGTSVILTAQAAAYNATPTYQWRRDFVDLPGATGSSLALGAVQLAQMGIYQVVATTANGSVASNEATVFVTDAVPAFTTQPVGATLAVGGTTVLSAAATGTLPLSYQWRRNGVAVAGATAASLVLSNTQSYQAGDYDVVATNPAGATASAVARLVVVPRVVAFSARLVLGSEGALGTFTVEGTASKTLLVRAVGPGLAPFGIAGALADPQLEIYNSAGTLLAVNDNWSSAANAAAISSTTAAVGAFALGVGSLDSAVLRTFTPGTYSVRANAASGLGGIAYLELYDADLATGPISTIPYVAVRGRVAPGNGVVIGGLGSNGRGLRSYLLRAVGPGLGLSSAVSDPSFLVVRDGALVGLNDNWDTSATDADAARTATTRLGLFPLAAGSKDAALVLTGNLHVGSHTLQVSSPEGPGGLVLVELHDLDAARAVALPPAISSPPLPVTVAAGSPLTLRALASGSAPLAYQWLKDGVPVAGATSSVLSQATATTAQAGNYTVLVTNAVGAATSLPALVTVQSGPTGNAATQAVLNGGYVAGGTATISNTLTFTGTPSSLGWSVVLPTGWSYAGDAGSAGDVRPAIGTTGTLEWAWSTVPSNPVNFSFTVNIPVGDTGAKTVVASGIVREGGNVQVVAATPGPLTINPVARVHSADSNADGKVSLFELTRVIELYNTRNGTTRTGCYAVQPGTEDGFAPDTTRAGSVVVSFALYHGGDSNRDGKLSLLELTRVIELYNYRSGTSRTGQYHVQAGTEDGFAPGP